MSHPLPPGQRDTRTTGWRYSNGNIHAGFDYDVNIGTPVFAVRKGHILRVVKDAPNLAPGANGKSGDPVNFIIQRVMFRKQLATVAYVHLSPNVLVEEGQDVVDGQQLAESGHNGHSTGPHLHIGAIMGISKNPFRHMHLLSGMSQPTDGIAGNGFTIYPPSLLYTSAAQITLPPNTILMADMKAGVLNSESVRRLQNRLNLINLPNSVQLVPTGNYNLKTRAEVKRWQMAKFGHPASSPKATGILLKAQVPHLFGDGFKVR